MKNKDANRIWSGSDFAGMAVGYGAYGHDVVPMQCNYELDSSFGGDPKEVRAYRKSRRRKGQKVKKLGKNKLRHELFVVFGPEMSAAEAVRTLKCLIKDIENNGLLIGRDDTDDYIIESLAGKLSR
jgi:hypothetical protein